MKTDSQIEERVRVEVAKQSAASKQALSEMEQRSMARLEIHLTMLQSNAENVREEQSHSSKQMNEDVSDLRLETPDIIRSELMAVLADIRVPQSELVRQKRISTSGKDNKNGIN